MWETLFGERKHCQEKHSTPTIYVRSAENQILLLPLVTEMVVTTSNVGCGGGT